jgi:magnesium transporter
MMFILCDTDPKGVPAERFRTGGLSAGGGPSLETSHVEYHFLSDLLGKRIFDESEDVILGKAADFVVDLDSQLPEVKTVVFRRRRSVQLWWIPWEDVHSIDTESIRLRPNGHAPQPLDDYACSHSLVFLKEFLLDKQIVDVYGAKVERVNDLQFLRSDGKMVLVHVDVGLRGLLRRIGFEDPIARFSKWFFDYELKHAFISWYYVEPLADRDRLKLHVPQGRLSDLHPADLADIMEELDVHERKVLVDTLEEEVIADALEEMDPKVQVSIMRGLEPEKAADIIEEMSPDDAADLIADLPQETAQDIFEEMDDAYEEKVKGLLEHEEDEAGGLMTVQFLALPPDKTIVDALAHIKQYAQETDVIYYIYIVDTDSRLLGVTNLRELLTHEIFTPLNQIMTTRLITARLDDEAEELGELFAKYGFRAIPVVDENYRVRGVIRFKALLDILAPHLGK